jgi:hypothetical protein
MLLRDVAELGVNRPSARSSTADVRSWEDGHVVG